MSPAHYTLQDEIRGQERAIRHLIGERAALNSRIKRLDARVKLERARLRREQVKTHPLTLTSGGRFPDVSNWQPNVDVNKVRQDTQLRIGQLMFTKVTEGTAIVDRYGTQRLREMAAAAFVRRGAYAFLHPSVGGKPQAQHLLDTLSRGGIVLGAADVIAADLEVSDGASSARVRQCAIDFAAEIHQHHPGAQWLYGGGPFLSEHGVTLDGYDAHWLPAYVGNPTPYMIYGRHRTVSWQFTDGHYGPLPHSAPGIGPCDLSIVL